MPQLPLPGVDNFEAVSQSLSNGLQRDWKHLTTVVTFHRSYFLPTLSVLPGITSKLASHPWLKICPGGTQTITEQKRNGDLARLTCLLTCSWWCPGRTWTRAVSSHYIILLPSAMVRIDHAAEWGGTRTAPRHPPNVPETLYNRFWSKTFCQQPTA